jgi:hypothetical protein
VHEEKNQLKRWKEQTMIDGRLLGRGSHAAGSIILGDGAI